MSFGETYNKIIGKYQRILNKAEHKWLRDIYTGRKKGIVVTPKDGEGLVPPEHLKAFENMLNRDYLRNYSRMKKEILEAGMKYLLK